MKSIERMFYVALVVGILCVIAYTNPELFAKIIVVMAAVAAFILALIFLG